MHRFLPILFFLGSCQLCAQSIVWVTACTNQTYCLDPGSCTEGTVFLTEKAVTSCTGGFLNYTYKIDLFNNGSIDIQSSADTVNQTFPVGTHKIIWRANDNCGNVSTDCTYLFTIQDCNPPNLLCLNGLTQNLEFPECEATFELESFILNITDNCTPVNELEFGLRLTSDTTSGFPTGTSLTFGICEQGLHTLEVFVRDENGLTNQCNSYVLVQNNSGLCPCNIAANLSLAGCATSADGTALDSYTIRSTLEGIPTQGSPFSETLLQNNTDSCFTATYADLPLDGAYSGVVRAQRLGDPLVGVSTFDLVTINKHILGQQLFHSFFQVLASDVNQSKTISTFDIIETRKLILGIYDTFPNAPAWRFILPMPDSNLLAFDAVRDTYAFQLPVLAGDTTFTGFNFIGIKMGDANANASFQGVEDRGAPLSVQIPDTWLEPGTQMLIPLNLQEDVELDGWQLALQADKNRLEIVDILGIPPQTVALDAHGALRIACVYDSPMLRTKNDALVYLLVTAKQPLFLSDALSMDNTRLAAEAYTPVENLPIRPIQVQIGAATATAAGDIRIIPPRPNPFAEKTIFELSLDAPQIVRLEIASLTGQLVYQAEYALEAGGHALQVLGAELPGSGVWAYRIVAGAQVATGRLVKF
ncbi:MAG: hypothetical protein R3D58_02950 [Saprospiraceae bacterium]|nr:hypothetical protein [Lewinellaceae bacterium]